MATKTTAAVTMAMAVVAATTMAARTAVAVAAGMARRWRRMGSLEQHAPSCEMESIRTRRPQQRQDCTIPNLVSSLANAFGLVSVDRLVTMQATHGTRLVTRLVTRSLA